MTKIVIPAELPVIGCILVGLFIPTLNTDSSLFDTYCSCVSVVSGL
ncbi:MAG: hypothetical protein Q3980_02940 [Turicibacter sp.]|nr:hypothetical protein [Turicibacter sp.]